ncbi:MAG: tetratricopeptide repeat protein [Desulfobaccales bacterium]
MWNRVPYLRRWARLGLAVLLFLAGCAGKPEPFAQQVQRINEASIQGDQRLSQGDLKRASRDFSRALALSRAVDYPQGSAQQLNNLGAVALEDGDLKEARECFTQAYDLNRDLKLWDAASINQANLATVAQKEGNSGSASQHLLAAQEAARQSRNFPAMGRVYLQWAGFYLDQGDPAAAQDMLNRAQPLATTPALKGTLFHHQGRLALVRGDTAQALERFTLALGTDRTILDRAAMAGDLYFLGEVYRARGDLPQAWEYYVRAFDVYAGLGRRSQLDRCLKRLQEVNRQGGLGRSLERFEKAAKPGPS